MPSPADPPAGEMLDPLILIDRDAVFEAARKFVTADDDAGETSDDDDFCRIARSRDQALQDLIDLFAAHLDERRARKAEKP